MAGLTSGELRRILKEIDEEAILELGVGSRYSMVLAGGAAFVLSNLTSRNVTDVDVLRADGALLGIIARHRQLDFQVGIYADRIPRGFESRLVRIPLDVSAVDFYRPSTEDLAVMKLYSWRKQDQIDLLSPEMLAVIDMGLLERLVYDEDEAKASAIAPLVYRNMVGTYEEVFKPKARWALRKLGKQSGRV